MRLRPLRPFTVFAFAAVLALRPGAWAAETPLAQGYVPIGSQQAAGIADLVLIYQGGMHRLDWTVDQLAPYVSRTDPASGKAEWLFDGFLFIEFRDDRGHEFAHGYKQKPARKEEWQWLLDRNFERDHAIDALDQAITRVAQQHGTPVRRRQVVLTLPDPIDGQKDWGDLEGRELDFTNADDRVAACAWHVQTALARWKAMAPKNLDLAGFYWVAESAHQTAKILTRISEDIHRHGKLFFWIPYWQSAGGADWRRLGFDVAYQQPNHFFNLKIPDSRLDAACKFARTHGMGLEFECDGRAMKSPVDFRPRLGAYLDAFERQGVRTSAVMAYYEGGGALMQMAQDKDPDVRALYERVARWVAGRQRQADAVAQRAAPR